MAKISRRDTLIAGLGAGAVATLPAGEAEAQSVTPTFTLLLVNDIYKMGEENGRGGFARLNAVVKAERAKGTPLLYAHAGDMFSPSLMSGFDKGAHTVALLNLAPPDIFVPGNHEFDFGKDNYFERHAESRFPYFAANLRAADGSVLPGHKDSELVALGGVKLGVVGLALPQTVTSSSPGDLQFGLDMATLEREVPKLRQAGADLILVVAHIERLTALQILRARLADIMLTGHTHDLVVLYDGRTVLVEGNEEGRYVTAVDLTVSVRGEGATKQVSFIPSFRIIDSRTVTPDPETLALIATYEAKLSKELDVEIATLAAPLDSRPQIVRGGEAAIGNLIADAMRAATGADVAITNGGGIRAAKQYAAGTRLTRRDVLSELPFGNRTVVVKVTGAVIRAALENGFSTIGGRFPQVSGLTVVAERGRPSGSRVVSITVAGAPLDEAKTYSLATNDFMLKGGDGYGMLAEGLDGLDDMGGNLVASDVAAYAEKLGTIAAKVEGRIVIR